ncbi:MAG TPA: TraR/DksA C4-type zinc finger protein [Nevskiaceae bacterium]|nr:TraR/DksA C4-type zinc finger protein [Nevskiaceae bacterium]
MPHTRPTARKTAAPRTRTRPVTATVDGLTVAQLAHFRARLTHMRDLLLAAADVPTEADHAHGDDADVAGATSERIASMTDMARRRDLLREVAAALKKIADGDYGFCEETGEPIDAARLEVNPTARYSLAAQERLERHRAARRR